MQGMPDMHRIMMKEAVAEIIGAILPLYASNLRDIGDAFEMRGRSFASSQTQPAKELQEPAQTKPPTPGSCSYQGRS